MRASTVTHPHRVPTPGALPLLLPRRLQRDWKTHIPAGDTCLVATQTESPRLLLTTS